LDVCSYLFEVWPRQGFPKSNGTKDPFRRGSSVQLAPMEVRGGTRWVYENGYPAPAALKRGICFNSVRTFLSGVNLLRQQLPYLVFEPQSD
jgi:hypothetical protein